MQTDKLYPTAATTGSLETTSPFMSIPELIDDMGDQYLMGYVPSDEMGVFPAVDITNAGDVITMSRKTGNFGWGYCTWGYNSGAGPGTIYYNDNGTLVRSWGINYDCVFINAAEMCRLNTRPGMSIFLSVASVNNSLIDGNKMTQFADYVSGQVSGVYDGWLDFTIDGYHDIIENDAPFFDSDVTVIAEGKTVHLTLRPSDFENNNGIKFALMPTEYDFMLHCRIVGFRMNQSRYYHEYNDVPDINIMPFFQIPHNDGKMILMPGNLDFAQININYSNGAITAGRGNDASYYNNKYIQNGDNATIFGGFDFGSVSVNDIDFTYAFAHGSGWAFVRNYVFVIIRGGSGNSVTFRVNAMYTPRDVYNYVRFFHKRTDTPSDSYSAADTVTVFTNSNEPTLKTVSGTLSDIQLDLQPWQYPGIDIKVNTFSPSSIPSSGGSGKNLIRFGNITPSKFLFGDISIEKIYFGSSILYQKFVPEQYVKLIPTDKFTIGNTSADDYRVYGPLPAGNVVLSVRTPRTKNLIPFPYWGVMAGPGGSSWEPHTDYDSLSHASLSVTDYDDGTFEWAAQTTANFKSMIRFEMNRAIFPAGTYTASHCMGTYLPGFGVYTYNLDGTQRASYGDNNPGGSGTGKITFTETESFLATIVLYCAENYSYSAGYSRPQLERGSTVTEYEPPNDPTLTTITLPRALEENEYISYADQKIMPTGTPITVPKLKTIIGENVIMIENYPRATNTITLTPETKE